MFDLTLLSLCDKLNCCFMCRLLLSTVVILVLDFQQQQQQDH